MRLRTTFQPNTPEHEQHRGRAFRMDGIAGILYEKGEDTRDYYISFADGTQLIAESEEIFEKDTNTFSTPYDQYRERNGEVFELVRVIDVPDETHDAEVLPMYVIRFEDGTEIEAWPEELLFNEETESAL